MNFFNNFSIRTKLLNSFLLCVFVTFISILFSIFSFNKIETQLSFIKKNMENQGTKLTEEFKINALIYQIENCKNLEILNQLEIDFLNESSKINLFKRYQELPNEIKKLIKNQKLYLKAMSQLKDFRESQQQLQKSYQTRNKKLEENRKIVTEKLLFIQKNTSEISDNKQFESTIAIEDTLEQIPKENLSNSQKLNNKIEKIVPETSQTILVLKQVYDFKTSCYQLNALVQKNLQEKDIAVIDYGILQIDSLLKNINKELTQLDKNNENTNLKKDLNIVEKLVKETLDLKKQFHIVQQNQRKTKEEEIKKNQKKISQQLNRIQKSISEISDTKEFESILNIEQIIEEIPKENEKLQKELNQKLNQLMSEINQSILTLQVSYHLKANYYQLNTLVQRSLQENDIAIIDYGLLQITSLLKDTQKELSKIQTDSSGNELKKSLETIKNTIQETLESKKQLILVSEEIKIREKNSNAKIKEIKSSQQETLKHISAKTKKLREDTLGFLKTTQEENNKISSSTTKLINTQKLYQILIGVISLSLAIFIGFFTAKHISDPLKSAVEVIEGVASGNLQKRLSISSQDETGRLSEAINQTINSINKTLQTDQINWDQIAQQRQELEKMYQKDKVQMHELKTKVNHILEIVDGASQGDLTQNIEVKGDESIGKIGVGLETFFKKLRESISSISDSSNILSHSSEELTILSNEMNTSAQNTFSQASVVSNASEQINKILQVISISSEEMASTIKEIAQNASQASQIAQDSVFAVRETNKIINKLNENSSEINQIVQLITNISEQTKLLSLNATIEAARAGQAGKGFAVVANEVKNLAKETVTATKVIGPKIELIQSETKQAVESINKINEVIYQVNSIQTTISSAVEEQSITTNEINKNIAEANLKGQEILESIKSVAVGAENTSSNAFNIQDAANELLKMATNLQQIVGTFKYENI